MVLRFAVVSSLVALAGCASYTWTKEGATPESVRAAQISCQQVSSRPADVFEASARARMGPGVESQMRSSDLGSSCMRSLGYVQVPAKD